MDAVSIFVIGSANTDMVVKAATLPLPGETVLGGQFFMNAGGKGANQAVAAARMGANVTFVAKVGDDIFGIQTIEGLQREKINIQYIFKDKIAPSGTALINVNEEGENCIVVAPGANANLLPKDIENISDLAAATILLTQLETPIETIAYLAALATSNNQKLVLNPAPAQLLAADILETLFLITPNETEASILTGIKVIDEITAQQAAAILLAKGVQNVIITMGSKGAFFKNNETQFMVPAPEVKAVDTTAAGDTFNGAIVAAIAEGQTWENAIAMAVKAASISVTRLGAQASVPYRNEI
jgi:ribokinase